MKKHANVAVFVPHKGCPNVCSFCDQRSITGHVAQPSPRDVDDIIHVALKNTIKAETAEIAFFGGSFTAIDKGYMLSLLEVAYSYVNKGFFSGIRISTRPDAIDDDVLGVLREYKVTTIELGAQSMSDKVLKLNNRGHTSNDVVIASDLIHSYDFKLGLQMMVGLYGSNVQDDRETAQRIKSLIPDVVRVYPTVILEGTELSNLYRSGEYVPFDFDTVVDLCADILEMFEGSGIPVIRLGLHDSEELRKKMIGGVFHPAFREICDSILMRRRCLIQFKESGIEGPFESVYIQVNPRSLSKMIGQKKCNIRYFKDMGINVKIVPNDAIAENKILVKKQQVGRD